MLTKLYKYLQKYKDEKIEYTKNSTLFHKTITIYNNTIYKLIILLNKITYTPPKLNNKGPNIEFHEECIYY